MRSFQILAVALLITAAATAARADTFSFFGSTNGTIGLGAHIGSKYTDGPVPTGLPFPIIFPNAGAGGFAPPGVTDWHDATWFIDGELPCCGVFYHPDHTQVEIDDKFGQAIAFVDFEYGDGSFYEVGLVMPTPGIPLLSLINSLPAVGPATLRIVANGGLQEAIHVQWDDGTSDTFSFSVDTVPEPSSWLLLATAGLLIAWMARAGRRTPRRKTSSGTAGGVTLGWESFSNTWEWAAEPASSIRARGPRACHCRNVDEGSV
jgi:hypothetical protein